MFARNPMTVICWLLASTCAQAYQPLVTDDTGTQGKGGNQIEFTWINGRDHDRSSTPATTVITDALPLVYTHGITDTLDLYAGGTWLRIKDGSSVTGWGNPVAGAKWRFYEREDGFSLGFKPEIQFPVSVDAEAKGLGVSNTSYSGLLILTCPTGFGVIHANAFYARVSDDTGSLRKDQWRLSLAPVWQVDEHWKLALDLGLQTHPDRASNKQTMGYGLIGAVYSPHEKLDLSLGAQKLFDNGRDTRLASLGLTWRF